MLQPDVVGGVVGARVGDVVGLSVGAEVGNSVGEAVLEIAILSVPASPVKGMAISEPCLR